MIKVRNHLAAIERIDSADTRGAFIRLDRNDRATPLEEGAFRAILATLGPEVFGSYPDPQPLAQRFAREVGLSDNQVLATNGSDAAIRRAFHAFLDPGDRVLSPSPTYAMYGVYAKVFQADFVTLDYDAECRLDLERFIKLIGERPRIVALANPDQPTGAALQEEDLRRIVAAARDVDALCLIDEAYYPCHPVTAVNLISDFDNLLVTRSFSKAYGLGGLRLGFACAQPALLQGLDKVRGLHEVNQMAIAVGQYLLDHPELTESYMSELEAGRALLADFAERHGFGFPRCPTNFQLIQLPGEIDAREVVAEMKERGFLIKGGMNTPSVRNCLRISLAGPDVMKGAVDALETILSSVSGNSRTVGS